MGSLWKQPLFGLQKATDVVILYRIAYITYLKVKDILGRV